MMAQDNVVKAFRRRLASAGYTDISIIRLPNADESGPYGVMAVEPLAGVRVRTKLHLLDMYEAFRRRGGTLGR